MMRAFVVRQLSDDLSGTAVEEVASPQPGAGDVLVQVEAAGVNFPDYLMCQGKYQFKPEPPFTPGMEAVGRIVALGAGVEGWAIGQTVAAGLRLGGFAEYVCVPEVALRAVPAALSVHQAAGFQAAYLTAFVALHRRADLQPGETVLVHGAAGGVGLAAVDLALLAGARVIATASSAEKRSFLADFGAHHVLAPEGFREAVKDLTNGNGADVIYDPVGGDVFDESVRCIAFGGRLLVVGFAGGRIASVSTNMPLIKGFSVIGVRAGEYGRRYPDRGRENLEATWGLAEQGRVRPHVHNTIPLVDARAALLLLPSRTIIGKLVITP